MSSQLPGPVACRSEGLNHADLPEISKVDEPLKALPEV